MRYLDRNGNSITDGCTIRYEDGKTERVYLMNDGRLGTDATNPTWIENGRAAPCEYGLYPLRKEDLNNVEVVESPIFD